MSNQTQGDIITVIILLGFLTLLGLMTYTDAIKSTTDLSTNVVTTTTHTKQLTTEEAIIKELEITNLKIKLLKSQQRLNKLQNYKTPTTVNEVLQQTLNELQ